MEVRLPGHSHLLSPEMRAGGALFVLSQLPEHILGVAGLRQWGGGAAGVRENTGVWALLCAGRVSHTAHYDEEGRQFSSLRSKGHVISLLKNILRVQY